MGVAQLSNRILIPPDALPFEGNPRGKFLGYTYMALPFTDPVDAHAATRRPPTGDQAWTCFVASENFKGPIAYYIPETWSKIAKLFDEPFLHGRGLDTRPGVMGGGAMEINTVPRMTARARDGTTFTRIPKIRFPVDTDGRAVLVQDVTYYSKAALYDGFLAWRRGGAVCDGIFKKSGSHVAKLTARTPRYDQGGVRISGVNEAFEPRVFDDNTWGLVWKDTDVTTPGTFPEYYRHDGDRRVAVSAGDVPKGTGLHERAFTLAKPGEPFTSPKAGAWTKPGPASPALRVKLGDGSLVTYRWYRFVDQPSFQQYRWSRQKREALQRFVEQIHRHWPTDRDYMAPPTTGALVRFDPALLVTPPKGMERGFVPIVTRQERQ